MRIQIVSDLHLEFGPIEIKNAGADVLVLSGDICVAKDINRPDGYDIMEESPRSRKVKHFFTMLSLEFPHVVYVMGNHEHYHGSIDDSKKILTDMLEELNILNIHIMENQFVTIDDVVFAGATLWTDCNKEDPVTLFDLRRMMNDYQIIKYGEHSLFPADTVEFHKKTLEFLKNVVAENNKVVIVGHHAPSKISTHPRYKNEVTMNGGYSSDLSDFILDNPQIKLWTHGHTHESFDYMIGSTRIVCNPRGYFGHAENVAFDGNKVVEI